MTVVLLENSNSALLTLNLQCAKLVYIEIHMLKNWLKRLKILNI